MSYKIIAAIAWLLITRVQSAIDVQWQVPTDGQPYDPITASVGDTITFFGFSDYSHNVYIHPSGTCNDTDAIHIGSTNQTEYTFEELGVYTFACDISSGAHCNYGQIINVTVTSTSSSSDNEDGGEDEDNEDAGEDEDNEEEVLNEESDNNENKDDVLEQYTEFFNLGEEKGLLEFQIKPYKVPHETTTYIDFVFNLPEDIAEIVHIVFGDVIVSQPKHLHHFVVTGCTESIDPSLEGIPLNSVPESCAIPLGGWAVGGDLYGGYQLDSGMLFGRGIGVEAILLNVHYTDGDDIDLNHANDGMHAIATDGIRILYTPNLRPKTILLKPLINVPFGPKAMSLPPNAPRYFYTKTCNVQSSCQDIDDEKLKEFGEEYTCANFKPFCFLEIDFKQLVHLLCPMTCGLCNDNGSNGNTKDYNPGEYFISAVNYHAHLTGREMYTTLLPNSDDTPIDLESKDLWLYDYQVTYPLHDKENDNPYVKLHPEDKIQATCVYDTTSRDQTTQFGLSTYDEMCITMVHVLLDTPNVTADNSQSLITMLNLKSFRCALDDSSDIWGGFLEVNEDARNIWKDHPITKADCTFSVGTPFGAGFSIIGDTVPTRQVKCGGETERDYVSVCDDSNKGTIFAKDAIAGGYCDGGTLDGEDSNDVSIYRVENNTTFKDMCTMGGGEYQLYTCEDVEDFLNGPSSFYYDQEELEYTRIYWYQSKCCVAEQQEKSNTTNDNSGVFFTDSSSFLFLLTFVPFLLMAY